MREISRLQFITTNATLAEQACKGGVDWIQLRLKHVSYDEYRTVAKEVQAVCKKYNATFIINDNIQLALELKADGIHVGKEDPLPKDERDALLNRSGIIGCTANTIEDFIHLSDKPVSYIGLGPYRFTETKKKLSPILGLNGYKKIFSQLSSRNIKYPPVIGIGGITTDDVSVLMTTGLHGLAVSGAISSAPDVTTAAATFADLMNPANKQLNKTITINAPALKAWRVLTDPALISEWFADAPVEVTTDWKEGSNIILNGIWHNKPHEHKGTILKYQPEQLLSYTNWNPLSGLPDTPDNYSTIEFRIHPSGGQTELTLTQSNFKLDTIYRHYNFFWTLTLDRLKKIIERV